MIHAALTKSYATFGFTVTGICLAVLLEPLSTFTKFGLLFSGALLGALFFIFVAISRAGMKNLTRKLFEAFAMLLVGLVAGGFVVEVLAYRYRLYEHRSTGEMSPDALIYMIVGVSFTITAAGYDGVRKLVSFALEIARLKLGQQPTKKDE